ncbi:Holliday junction branch migration protein RuvA [Megasphaera hominis]|jgi:Holliday junction DNA helicase RuvA|uniref:Holliday junction branch migration complex subunit RuvA n=1 Tax=Megasphaera hominis TaxID=159836 RepID=A0ABR6VKL9_9FIRM|nr:Holliday junction branch migration protein RuvA [Megasphaera hominis]MBC3536751.1 Holliday junction branch migration protein RuvA [Megasphaera hominis]
MIGYLKGKITHVFANSCFIEVGGVGYRTIVSGTTLGELSVGKETMLYTYMSVTENDITLYGFLTQDEYELFLLLITVNGIGPKLAVNALGAVTPDTLRLAISQNNMSVLTKLPGIGKKTANRLVLELKDKIGTVDAGDMAIKDVVSTPAGGAAAETLAALQSLGYAEQEVLPAIQKYAGQYDNVEDLLKIVLRTLGSGR